ncbi:winged helix-turn-helix transcriptional regulator [Dactylosporangium sp. CA-139114]|uniref:winged helix-turn-helix transcriptional regulator n=1 Tax=Dactylosporangium sp. CA-139114 TaxID=3239931 RepID=UPI003D967E15
MTHRKLNVAILEALKDGPLRYTQLHHAVSNVNHRVVHNRTLTDTLTYLRRQRLIEHRQHDDSADYRLTAGGAELVDLLAEINRWSRQHRAIGGP